MLSTSCGSPIARPMKERNSFSSGTVKEPPDWIFCAAWTSIGLPLWSIRDEKTGGTVVVFGATVWNKDWSFGLVICWPRAGFVGKRSTGPFNASSVFVSGICAFGSICDQKRS